MVDHPKLGRRAFLSEAGLLSGSALLAPRAAVGTPDLNILRPPDLVALRAAEGLTNLTRNGESWQAPGVEVKTEARADELTIAISAPSAELERILLRWHCNMPGFARFLGDHWERSYGDLEWRNSVPNRVMPWYFLLTNGRTTSGFGVQTGAGAICFWQADPEGISLWLDVRNGGSAVKLGERVLPAATVVSLHRKDGGAFETARELCLLMCGKPRLPAAPVYGGNNWYYTYGENFSAADILRDSELLAELADGRDNRPFMVTDMGWERAAEGAGPTAETNERFRDMPGLAAGIKKLGVRPGIWKRPLLTTEKLPEGWRIPGSAQRMKPGFFVMDPSVPEALAHIKESVAALREWGFEMIKHDFSTYDMLGRWGFEMGVALTDANWNFADRSRTTAEIVSALYRTMREAAGDGLLIGCNTIGHLGAGSFELQRIGDDTSGRDWERTRKMGVNTLAFRLPQHNAFFIADADCVPLTPQIPWEMTRQWLDLVARSGTALFISPDPRSIGPEQKAALKIAFTRAAEPQPQARPLTWLDATAPAKWSFGGKQAAYDWYLAEGASPFAS